MAPVNRALNEKTNIESTHLGEILKRTDQPTNQPNHCRNLPSTPNDLEVTSVKLDALGTEACLLALGWKGIGKLGASGALGKDFLKGETAWGFICQALAQEAGLHLPDLEPKRGWRHLFWDQLWPARGKWQDLPDATLHETAGTSAGQGFKIQVATRFRPRRHAEGSKKLVLPLHQRLKLMKKGEKLDFWGENQENTDENYGLSETAIKKLVESGAELSPEIIQALMEAEQLEHAGKQARREADQCIWKGDGDMNFDDDGAQDIVTEEANSDQVNSNGSNSISGQAANSSSTTCTKTREEAEDPERREESAVSAKKRGTRVLALQDSRVVLFVPGLGIRPFHFSGVYNPQCEQRDVYESTARDSVLAALNGFNACLLCYGQTGSGKTYTILGPEGVIEHATRQARKGVMAAECGIVPRACNEVLQACRSGSIRGVTVTASVQYVQIYQETVTDLVSGRPVQIRTGGDNVVLDGADQVPVESLSEALSILAKGEERKHYAEPAMNGRSSRAHTVFVMHICQANETTGTMVRSQLHLVDLAGCEQIKQSKVVGKRKVEAVGINSSLLVLGKCITALVEARSHVPYFESKLTLLLRGAFGGNSRTTAMITGSMDAEHGDQTFQALAFGERCSMITNSAKFSVTSVEAALNSIDEALVRCEKQMRSLEERGKTQLDSYVKVSDRYQSLKQKRLELGILTQGSRCSN